MKNPLMRFRPYLRSEEVILFERLREVTDLSMGKILMSLLVESETFVKLSQMKDAEDAELRNTFIGLCSNNDYRHN